MSDQNRPYSIRKCTLSSMLEEYPIRVPKIQRDYAQGRKNDAANDIRSKFVHDLVTAISPTGAETELDFVYGSYRKGAFEPLDGQQRLTTLFLIHWICGVDLYDSEKKQALLSYETRNTSTDFCLELVKHSPEPFIAEIARSVSGKKDMVDKAEAKLNALKSIDIKDRPDDFGKLYQQAKQDLAAAKDYPVKSFSSMIQNRDWFNYLWKFDPTVQSMLVMLDAVYEEMHSRELTPEACRENLGRVTFSDLDLGSFNLSDELFIKMNARGKQLSSFDIIKSTLEEEIQVQKKEGHCTTETEALWRSLVDGEWIDWFWNQFASDKIGAITENEDEYKERLNYAKTAEEFLKRLILRIITLRLVRVNGLNDILMDYCYRDNIENLDRLLIVYNDALRADRSKDLTPDAKLEIDFPAVISDMKSLYYKDRKGTYKDLFSLIPMEFSINSSEVELTLLHLALSDKFNNDCKIIFYALLKYLKLRPAVIENGIPNPEWVDDFSEWAHFCRNLFINENNNVRIDDTANFMTAVGGVDKLIEKLRQFITESPIFSTIAFIRSLGSQTITGVDNQSLAEEVEKAALKLSDSGEWRSAINNAEAHRYLWGQIRCLLNWAGGNRLLFEDYFMRLSELLNYRDKNLVYAGILSVEPGYGFENNKMYLFSNKHRDYGYKRFLRDEGLKGKGGVYAPAIKKTLDTWRDSYSALSFEEFLKSSISSAKASGHSYVNCILEKPNILNDAWDKMVFPSDGHFVIAQRKTPSSHCYDIALDYLFYTYEDNDVLSSNLEFYDSVSQTHKHAILIPYGTNRLLIKATPNGGYDLIVNDTPDKSFTNEKEMLDYVLNTYPVS